MNTLCTSAAGMCTPKHGMHTKWSQRGHAIGQVNISRARFEDMCSDFFQRCMKTVEEVMNEAKVNKDSIHEVVLIGGSTRIPRISADIERYFGPCSPVLENEVMRVVDAGVVILMVSIEMT